MSKYDAREAVLYGLMTLPDVACRRMFGCDAFLVKGKLFAFHTRRGLVVKLPEPTRSKVLEHERAVRFEIRPGLPFGLWVELGLDGEDDGDADSDSAVELAQESYRYVLAELAKAPEKRRRRARLRPGGRA